MTLVFSASSWLETEAGRNLLQRELGKSLGLKAELREDYALKLFPGIRIAGKQLLLSPVDTNQPIAEIDAYELHLALWPLLRKEILIHKLAVYNGRLDVDLLSQQAETGVEGPALQLPKIESMVITGLRLFQASKESIRISRLEVQNFADSRKAPFNLELTLPATTAKSSTISLEGVMQLAANPFKISLDVDGVLLSLDGQAWPLGAGQLNWSGESGEATAQLQGKLLGFSSNIELSAQMTDSMILQARLELRSSDSHLLAARLQAVEEASRWSLQQVNLNLDGQELVGSGCLETSDPVLLQLQLHTNQLDVDALQELLPANLLPASNDKDSASLDLPLQLAIVLNADQATMSGAIGRDVRLLLGSEPDCSADGNQLLN
ncbi:MAG: hypothetical protein SH820_11560 [Xanthomonadales bacterium]|nr:hypothetical protein [Xanthomonadales bacterium]